MSITFSAATKNVICFGGTGSGKTTGVCLPALDRLLENDCPGLVLDVKGDYAKLARLRSSERIVVVGPTHDATPINLISGFTVEIFQRVLQEALPASRDSRWQTQGINQAAFVFVAIAAIEGREPNLNDIWGALVHPFQFVTYFKDNKDKWIGRFEVTDRYDQLKDSPFSMFAMADAKKASMEDTAKQYTWETADVVVALSMICGNPVLRHFLCASGTSSFSDMIYKENKVIVLDMPETLFGNTAHLVSKVLRERLKNVIMTANPGLRRGFGKHRFSFLLVDEYQQHITDSDNLWFDRSRSFGHINIVATQSISSLYANTANSVAADTIIQNCRNQIILPSIDKVTCRHASDLFGRPLDEFLIRPKARGNCIVYLTPDDGLVKAVRATTGQSLYPFMNLHIKVDLLSSHPSFYITDEKEIYGERVATPGNPGLDDHLLIDFDEGPRLFVITTSSVSHCGFQDFLQTLNKVIDVGCMTVLNISGGSPGQFVKATKEIIADAKPGDIVAIVRGGGDVESPSFNAFRGWRSVRATRSLRKNGLSVITGIGHSTDSFPIDPEATFCEITPTAAAYRVLMLFQGIDDDEHVISYIARKAREVHEATISVISKDATPTEITTPTLASEVGSQSPLADALANDPANHDDLDARLLKMAETLNSVAVDSKSSPGGENSATAMTDAMTQLSEAIDLIQASRPLARPVVEPSEDAAPREIDDWLDSIIGESGVDDGTLAASLDEAIGELDVDSSSVKPTPCDEISPVAVPVKKLRKTKLSKTAAAKKARETRRALKAQALIELNKSVAALFNKEVAS